MSKQRKRFYQPDPSKAVVLGILSVMLVLTGVIFIVYRDRNIGVVLISIFVLLTTHRKGCEFDLKKNRFRLFNEVLFIRFGNWLSLEDYKKYHIVNKNQSYQLNSRLSTSEQYTDHNYDVILETSKSNHTDIRFSVTKEKIKKVLQFIGELGLQRTKFNLS